MHTGAGAGAQHGVGAGQTGPQAALLADGAAEAATKRAKAVNVVLIVFLLYFLKLLRCYSSCYCLILERNR